MQEQTLEAVAFGNVRPNRIYEGKYKGTECGGGVFTKDGKGAIRTPGGVIITTERDGYEWAREAGLACWIVESFEKAVLKETLEKKALSPGLKRALRWMLE